MEYKIKKFRKEYEYYADWVNKTNQTNQLWSAPNWWELTFSIPKMKRLQWPPAPAEMKPDEFDDFTNTEAVAGYGMPTAFMYNTTKEGYKSYGVLG